ncbi:MAG: LytTR family DNA-binding domain-containing protein [Lachnospiraceae bacterium]|nr:LytTR family DNA-binding domain-containing protein [Lachnospiraceae bacterium]
MRIAICDDSVLFQEQFTNLVRRWDGTQCPECFSTGAELLKAAAEPPAFDIVFVDICFPGENGIDIAAKIRKLSPETGIVFLTCSEDHAVDAYTVDALHYLVKPPSAEDVREVFRRLEIFRSRQRPTLSLVVERNSVLVYLDTISYIISDGHAKEIHLTDGQILCVRMQLRELEKKLDETFLKLNKGSIVNMEQIRTMHTDYCLLRDGTKLGFSRRERAAIRGTYDQFVYSRLFEKEKKRG